MVSAIDPTKPAQGSAPLKSDLRANLQAAHDEIEQLQVDASISADAGNAISRGTDGGLLAFANGAPRVHLSETAVAPAVAGLPTLAEITTAAGANRGRLLYYTGTDAGTDTPTHVYTIDSTGDITVVEDPFNKPLAADRVITTDSSTLNDDDTSIVFQVDTTAAFDITALRPGQRVHMLNEGMASIPVPSSVSGYADLPPLHEGELTLRASGNVYLEQVRALYPLKKTRTAPAGYSGPDHTVTVAEDGQFIIEDETWLANTVRGDAPRIFVSTAGNDANDGLSPATAFRTMNAAYAASVDSVISVEPGVYFDLYPTFGTAGRMRDNSETAIIAQPGGDVVFANANDPTAVVWTDNADGTFTTVEANPLHPIDLATLDEFGNPAPLPEVADAVALATASAGYFAAAGSVTVKPFPGRHMDSNMLLLLNNNVTIRWFRPERWYIDGLRVYGHSFLYSPSSPFPAGTADVTIRRCTIGYGVGDSLSFEGPGNFRIAESTIAYSGSDGLNYGANSLATEYKVLAYRSGYVSGQFFDQASTGHSGSLVTRIASKYYDCTGQAVADVGPTSETWMVGCDVANSQLSALLDFNASGPTFLDTVVGRDQNGVLLRDPSSVSWMEASGTNTQVFHTASEAAVTKYTP